jgi:protein-S-isoprenylcysteine O-methyltransferase Ste14
VDAQDSARILELSGDSAILGDLFCGDFASLWGRSRKGSGSMQYVLAFKLVQFAILSVFIAFISDFRSKEGMVPLVSERWTCLLKFSYLVPFAVYAQVLVSITSVSLLDAFSIGLTLLGTALVAKAKIDLASHHTWAGYCAASSGLITEGIYAYIRHPIYTGIYVLILGSLFTILPRINLSVSMALPAAALVSVSYTMGFIAYLANKETAALLAKCGPPFKRYVESVHAFLPIRRYSVSAIE